SPARQRRVPLLALLLRDSGGERSSSAGPIGEGNRGASVHHRSIHSTHVYRRGFAWRLSRNPVPLHPTRGPTACRTWFATDARHPGLSVSSMDMEPDFSRKLLKMAPPPPGGRVPGRSAPERTGPRPHPRPAIRTVHPVWLPSRFTTSCPTRRKTGTGVSSPI